MTVQLTTRKILDLDKNLFPKGVPPWSIIEMKGSSGSGKTYLMTYLLARFIAIPRNSERRAIFIDTRNHFNMQTFLTILLNLLPDLNLDITDMTQIQKHPVVIKLLERLTIIKCFTPEDLLFLFGPNNEVQLERMLIVEPKFSIVFIDSLDNFTYCASMSNMKSSDYPDFVKLLKRSVNSTGTPVIYSVLNVYQWKRLPKPNDDNNDGGDESFTKSIINESSCRTTSNPEPPRQLISNINFEPNLHTHSIVLESVPITQPSKETFICKTDLRSRNNPNKLSLSGENHLAKFSILSGMLNWLNTV